MTAAAVLAQACTARPAPTQRKPPSYTPLDRSKCKHECVGGNACIGDARYPHQYHLCQHEDCACRVALRGLVTYARRPRRTRIAWWLTQGNTLDLWQLMQHIGGKRARTAPGASVGRAPYSPRGGLQIGVSERMR